MSYTRLLLTISLPLNDNKKSVMNSKKASYEEKEKKNNKNRNNESFNYDLTNLVDNE